MDELPDKTTPGNYKNTLIRLISRDIIISFTIRSGINMKIKKRFKGRNISDFLERFELSTEAYGVQGDQALYTQIIFYSIDTIAYTKVKAVIKGKTQEEAKRNLKKVFKTQDR